MRLAASRGGACVDLRVAGYQFPDIEPAHHQLDANWLVITGAVRAPDGTSWSFQEPVLTAGEAVQMVTWLRQVADGAVATASAVEDTQAVNGEELDRQERLQRAGWLTFTEPNLNLAAGGYRGEHVQLLVGLGHESAPPSVDPYRPGWRQIGILLGRHQIRRAATALEQELLAYPVR